MEFGRAPRSTSRPRPESRPTTPLRPSSRSSIRDGHGYRGGTSDGHGHGHGHSAQHAISSLEPQFAELADSMADLEANFMHLQLMHESLSRFSESFASFLYGLNMNAFCIDFPEAPIAESFRRAKEAEATFEHDSEPEHDPDNEGDTALHHLHRQPTRLLQNLQIRHPRILTSRQYDSWSLLYKRANGFQARDDRYSES